MVEKYKINRPIYNIMGLFILQIDWGKLYKFT